MLHQVGLLLVLAAAQEAAAQPHRLPPPVYEVTMEVRLNPQDRSFQGHELLQWKNTASRATEELQFHLYLNAFANN